METHILIPSKFMNKVLMELNGNEFYLAKSVADSTKSMFKRWSWVTLIYRWTYNNDNFD